MSDHPLGFPAASAARFSFAWRTIGLIGRNLTDKLVVTAANDIPFAGGPGTGTAGPGVQADMSAFVDNPREIYVEVGFKF